MHTCRASPVVRRRGGSSSVESSPSCWRRPSGRLAGGSSPSPRCRERRSRCYLSRLTERVTAELVRRGQIMVIASASARAAAEGLRPAREISRALDAEFLLQARTRREGGRLSVEALLVNGARDQKFWVDSFSAGDEEIDELARRVAAGAAAAILSAPGVGGPSASP